jgi:rhamnopyranosyl-N-acetylglucosaminyl-diphospho-decaprenol beta-1,3/1,4-galactofuranosyltransferase
VQTRVAGLPAVARPERNGPVEHEPDPELVHRRLRRRRLRFGTCAPATYLHPQGHDDWAPILGGLLTVLVPADPVRRVGTFRNLGYLTAQPGLRWRRLPDEVRYLWYFLVQQRDATGWRGWRRSSRAGRRELFAADQPFRGAA